MDNSLKKKLSIISFSGDFEMSMHILGITKEDFIPEIKSVIGVANFLQYSEGGDRIFI